MTVVRTQRARPVGGWREEFATIAGRVVILGGLWSIVSIVFRPVRWVHWVDQAFGLLNLPVSPSIFSVTLLLVLGGALQRRKRISVWVLLVFQSVALAGILVVNGVLAASSGHVDGVRPMDIVLIELGGAISAVLIVLLWRSRSAFPARLQSGAFRRAVVVLVSGLALSIGLSIFLTMLFPGHLHTVGRKVMWAIRSAIGLEPDREEAGWHLQYGHHWITAVTGTLSALALIAAILVFLRSASSASRLSAQDELDVRGLLLRHGERDSLGYFATRHDKAAVFSPDHQAAVTFRAVASVSLASGDPIGASSAWPAAIDAWLARSQESGWLPAVLSASADGAQAYVAAGLKALPLGDEAIIDLDTFTLHSAAMQPVRRAVNRVHRAGYRIDVVRHSELSGDQLAEIAARAEDWRGDDTERGFSMALGRIGDQVDGRCMAVLAYDSSDNLRGLLSLVPWGSRGASLDLMRRDRTSENGLVEAMVAALAESGPGLGIRRVSLNFAMFRGVFSAADRIGAGPLVRIANRMLMFASRFWQLESLYRSNARYLPRWEPRFLCFDSSLTLTRVALAAGMAEGFLPAPLAPSSMRVDGLVSYAGKDGIPFAEAVEQQETEVRGATPAPVRRGQQLDRLAKMAILTAAGDEAYPVSVQRTTALGEIAGLAAAQWPTLPPDGRTGQIVSVAGRVRAVRDFGGLLFVVLQEGGTRVQAILERKTVGGDRHELFRRAVDVGDHLAVTGEIGTSEHGELSIYSESWQLAAKCLHPIPDLRRGIRDPDTRVRQRYLHLIADHEAREMIFRRSTAIRALRNTLDERGFLEVETPMLQTVHGGANARPFTTFINAYKAELSLRIAPELYLKRLCVGGLEKVYELNRNFRNEGADATHNPEFTSLEAYLAYADYHDVRVLSRELILAMATAVYGEPVARRRNSAGVDTVFDLSGDWPVVSVHDAISRACGHEITTDSDRQELAAVCAEHQVRVPTEACAGELVAELYDELVEPRTIEPTFYIDFPIETSPLTRVHRKDSRLAERWDLVAFGAELGTGYSELIDPIDQRERLVRQSLKAAGGDPDAMEVDEAFLTALEYAMPPTGGLGLGVDRLIMMLTGTTIRQTLAFPFVRPAPGG